MEAWELMGPLLCVGMKREDGVERAAACAQAASADDWEALCAQAQRHGVGAIVFAGLRDVECSAPGAVPERVFRRMSSVWDAVSLQYFSILSFTTYTLDLLRRENIPVLVLKGLTLSGLYPDEQMRTVSDTDFYIPDPAQFRRACEVLERDGFEPEDAAWDYHKEYTKELCGRRMLLELHIRPAGRMGAGRAAERRAMRLFRSVQSAELYECAAGSLPGLPAEMYALQLALHMMNHFLAEEFRLSMLCDWVAFWRAEAGAVRPERFASMLNDCGILSFAHLVTGICVRYLGLEEFRVPWTTVRPWNVKQEDALYRRFFEMNDGSESRKRVNAVLDSDLPVPIALTLEVHRQMRYRFPRAHRIPLLWPVLWGMTIAIFLNNNRVLGRGSVGKIIAGAGDRDRMLEELALTKRGDG